MAEERINAGGGRRRGRLPGLPAIFSRQGVSGGDQHRPPRQGLARATENDYAIILLDIKMPNMDGIEFLQRLREKKPNVPVLIITGYPEHPQRGRRHAAGGLRLRDQTVYRRGGHLGRATRAEHAARRQRGRRVRRSRREKRSFEAMANIETLFWQESWVQLAVDGSASVGAVLPGLRGARSPASALPRIGEVVYQGLPLAGVTSSGKPMLIVPSPISGAERVNNDVARRPRCGQRPCGEGWIACICATRNEEMEQLQAAASASRQLRSRFRPTSRPHADGTGVRMEKAADPGCPAGVPRRKRRAVVFLDAASLCEAGPGLVERINRQAPHARIVVIGSPAGASEAAYRKQKIFYYAVEPFADNEIADILVGVFHAAEPQPAKSERGKGPSEPISSVSITNRNLHKIQLLAAPGCCGATRGWGIDRAETARPDVPRRRHSRRNTTHARPTSSRRPESATAPWCLAGPRQRLLPGGLAGDTKPEFEVEPGQCGGQSRHVLGYSPTARGLPCLDARTIAARRTRSFGTWAWTDQERGGIRT